MVQKMPFNTLTREKPINPGKDRENWELLLSLRVQVHMVGGQSLWLAGGDVQALESQAKEMILFCRERRLTKLQPDLMKALLKAKSKDQMKDELQRKEVEGEGAQLIPVISVILIMCQVPHMCIKRTYSS